MRRTVVIDKIQLVKALGTLNIRDDGCVRIVDVLGVLVNCDTWLTNQERTEITAIPTTSQRRRIEVQILEADDAEN